MQVLSQHFEKGKLKNNSKLLYHLDFTLATKTHLDSPLTNTANEKGEINIFSKYKSQGISKVLYTESKPFYIASIKCCDGTTDFLHN